MSKLKIIPCFWFENEAKGAMDLYTGLFPEGNSREINAFLTSCSIDGCELWGINGGPAFRPNPTLSLYTVCTSEAEIDHAAARLSEGGKFLMPLDKYDWSPRYAWVEDRYGVSWQLTLGNIAEMGQRITPALMYTGDQFGRAIEAIEDCIAMFPESRTHFIFPYEDEVQQGKIAHAQVDLWGQRFIFQESGFMPGVSFTEGGSLVIRCKDQPEIDHYWEVITAQGEQGRCGWCKDRFGFSWQIIPDILEEIMADAEQGPKAAAAFQAMQKLDLQKILDAVQV